MATCQSHSHGESPSRLRSSRQRRPSWRPELPRTTSPRASPPVTRPSTRPQQFVCSAADRSSTVKLTAIGKFPYLALDCPSTEHGDVLVGQTAKASVRLLNQSVVPAHFTVEHAGPHNDGVFTLAPMHGTVTPGASAVLKLRYKPHFAGTFSSEAFEISTPGGNVVRLQQRGAAIGATVAASERCVDFGDVRLGRSVRKVCAASSEVPQRAVRAGSLALHGLVVHRTASTGASTAALECLLTLLC